MNESQTRIIEYLKQHHTASARDLSHVLTTTPANIRHHLLILQANSMVEVCGHQSPVGRGHPVYLYRLNPQFYRNNLPGLVRALLQLLDSSNIVVNHENMLRSLAHELVNGLPEINGSLTQRLSQAVLSLKAMNYEPRWEARRDGPRFMFANCPYAAVLTDHPELCQVDVFLLERFLGHAISQTARLGDGSPSARFCLFTFLAT